MATFYLNFSIVGILLCLFIYPIKTFSQEQHVPTWNVEIHYRYMIETEMGTIPRETLDKIEKLSLERMFHCYYEYRSDNQSTDKLFNITEMDSAPIDTIRSDEGTMDQN
jgi:hypothetical protein